MRVSGRLGKRLEATPTRKNKSTVLVALPAIGSPEDLYGDVF